MGEGKERAASAGAKNCQPEELCARDNERGAYTGRLLRDPPRHGPTSVRGAEHRREMPSKARWFHSGPPSELTTLARLDCGCDLLSYLPVSDEIFSFFLVEGKLAGSKILTGREFTASTAHGITATTKLVAFTDRKTLVTV